MTFISKPSLNNVPTLLETQPKIQGCQPSGQNKFPDFFQTFHWLQTSYHWWIPWYIDLHRRSILIHWFIYYPNNKNSWSNLVACQKYKFLNFSPTLRQNQEFSWPAVKFFRLFSDLEKLHFPSIFLSIKPWILWVGHCTKSNGNIYRQ